MKNYASVSFLACALVLAACGGGEKNVPDAQEPVAAPLATSATDTATHPGSPGGTAVVPEVDSGTTVLVVIEDGSIGVKEQTIPPGPANLTVTNAGSGVHNLFIEGEGISRAAGDNIPNGANTTVDVMFKPGRYVLYCPVADHRAKGEEATITIAAP